MDESMIESYRKMKRRLICEFRIISLAFLLVSSGRISEWLRRGLGLNDRCERIAYRTGRWCHVVGHICGGKCLKEEIFEKILGEKTRFVCKKCSLHPKKHFSSTKIIVSSIISYRSTWKMFWLHYQNNSWMALYWPLGDRSRGIHPLAAK